MRFYDDSQRREEEFRKAHPRISLLTRILALIVGIALVAFVYIDTIINPSPFLENGPQIWSLFCIGMTIAFIGVLYCLLPKYLD